jgi:FkbM family methyltransferase
MKYFIDCGTYFFQGLKEFEKKYRFDNNWMVYSFEANPHVFKSSLNHRPTAKYELIHENKAVWCDVGKIKIHCEGANLAGCSSTVLSAPPPTDKTWKSVHNWAAVEDVECLRLSDLLKSISKNSEKVVVKLDIEGAEFAVLKDLIDTDSLSYIDDLYVEFHERFFMDKEEDYRAVKLDLIETIKKTCKNFEVWR